MSTEIELAVLEQRTMTMETAMKKMDLLLEKIHDRPPIWAAWVMTVGGGVIGALGTWLVTCLK